MTQKKVATTAPLDAELEAVLRGHLRAEDRVLVIHSSIANLRPPESEYKWPFLRALKRLAASGITLAFPTFTFGFCRGAPFDEKTSRSETGVLGEWVLELDGAVRSAHPIYSFALIGPLAAKLAAARNSTTFGDDSTLALFEAENARIVMLGCGWEYCTQFHRYEERAKVPYRHYKTFHGPVAFAGGPPVPSEATMFVRDLDADAENDFSPIVEALRQRRQLTTLPLWSGTTESAACGDIAAAAMELLTDDPWRMVANRQEASFRLKNRQAAAKASPLRVALLGNGNTAFIEKWVAAELATLLPGQRVLVHAIPFGQLFSEVFSKGSALAEFQADISFFVNRIEDLTGTESPAHCPPTLLDDIAAQYHEAIRHYAQTSRGVTVACRLMRSGLPHDGLDDLLIDGAARKIETFNARLMDLVASEERLHVFDLDGFAVRRRSHSAYDVRLWHLGRLPFTEDFSRELASAFAGLVLAVLGRTCRLIVTDLDNTLWGGVLGEDGQAGLQLGGDFPGNTFLTLQRTLKSLHERGIALAISSKNDQEQVMAMLRDDTRMVLKAEDFATIRANWQTKWENISAICDELGLGLESVLFLDDNPVERKLVRRFAPQVKVHDLPEDPALYADSLLRSPWLSVLKLTQEDRQRGRQYAARRVVMEGKSTFTDLRSFYASLGIEITLDELRPDNRARAAQLSVKTNQFNTTTRRYAESALDELIVAGRHVAIIRSKDKYSAPENIGLIVMEHDYPQAGDLYIDNYLLSCRALGRGIEVGLLQWLAAAAKRGGYARLVGEISRTDRNEPASVVFQNAGFAPAEAEMSPDSKESTWILDIMANPSTDVHWLSIEDRAGIFE